MSFQSSGASRSEEFLSWLRRLLAAFERISLSTLSQVITVIDTSMHLEPLTWLPHPVRRSSGAVPIRFLWELDCRLIKHEG
jgi:hypothetical protein